MRYRVLIGLKDSEETNVVAAATNREQATIAFENRLRSLAPGEEIIIWDEKTKSKIRQQYVPTSEEVLEAMVRRFVGYKMDPQAARGRIESFSANVLKDPDYYMDSCYQYMKDAASLRVLRGIFSCIEKLSLSFIEIRDDLYENVMGRAKSPSNSSSQTYNLMEQYRLQAYTEMLQVIEGLIKELKSCEVDLTKPAKEILGARWIEYVAKEHFK